MRGYGVTGTQRNVRALCPEGFGPDGRGAEIEVRGLEAEVRGHRPAADPEGCGQMMRLGAGGSYPEGRGEATVQLVSLEITHIESEFPDRRNNGVA